MKIEILGTKYKIKQKNRETDKRLTNNNGLTDSSTKEIIIDEFKKDKTINNKTDLQYAQKAVIRHEIIHAFLFESGLDTSSEWARNEEFVDWLALQIPKIFKAMYKSKAI